MSKTKKWKKIMKKGGKFVGILCLCVFYTSLPVYASGATIIEHGFSNLLDLVKAFVSSIGTIIVLWGLFEWGNAMQSNDGMMQSMAFKRIGGGLVMTLGPQLLTLFV